MFKDPHCCGLRFLGCVEDFRDIGIWGVHGRKIPPSQSHVSKFYLAWPGGFICWTIGNLCARGSPLLYRLPFSQDWSHDTSGVSLPATDLRSAEHMANKCIFPASWSLLHCILRELAVWHRVSWASGHFYWFMTEFIQRSFKNPNSKDDIQWWQCKWLLHIEHSLCFRQCPKHIPLYYLTLLRSAPVLGLTPFYRWETSKLKV